MTPAEKIMREALEWIANPYPDKCFRSTEEARAAYVRRAAEALKRADEEAKEYREWRHHVEMHLKSRQAQGDNRE